MQRGRLTKATLIAAAALGLALPADAARAQPEVAPAEKKDLVDGNTRFAFDLYGQLKTGSDNAFCSPLSVSTALGMTYAGARGNTAKEMKTVLHFDLEPERLHPAMGALLGELEAPRDQAGYQLRIANALWAEQTFGLLPEFIALGQKHYRAGLRAVDFAHAAEAQRALINAWVEDHTDKKVKELIAKGLITPDTVLVLTNAVYFKGAWASKFDKARTHDAPFTVPGGKPVQVPLMSQTGEFGYLEQPDVQVLELPYAGGALSMVVVLPRKVDGLAEVEKGLSAKTLNGWISKLARQKVQVELPRFQLTQAYRLDKLLQKLGMRDAFTAKADFSGMNGRGGLFISAVVHKAFVDVNEEGTEAAAATGVIMRKDLAKAPPAFRADHPFLFVIRDVRSGSLLFLGRVNNPKQP